ncbi:hypothetical protein PISMIDRAFT_13418 [Pisolithus microcarpus 441]|uniref:Uncharacterized protein n=1 Tax=Pisolithus microcarpus 441 TaxID=765257 RepID=A0A0C9YSR6_9AGAM|nr:hypothetical protein PISMIDRAFT_13418 [Pisolithus microcarpus 441]
MVHDLKLSGLTSVSLIGKRGNESPQTSSGTHAWDTPVSPASSWECQQLHFGVLDSNF